VIPVGEVHSSPLGSWGPELRRHPRFGTEGVNVDLLAPGQGPGTFSIRTWERGVEGETLSCGSGAVAAAFLGYTQGAKIPISVVPKSGIALTVGFRGTRGAPEAAILEGDARIVFEGTLVDEEGQRLPA
jgi:diaminopimelate epimerase